MKHALSLLTLLLCFAGNPTMAEKLQGLLLTSPGIYHDYAYQTETITSALAREVNISFDVSLHELERWKTTDYSEGYDVLVYNICNADNTDAALIANMRRQTEILGTPTLVLHCTMHSFRNTDAWWPLYGLKTVHHEPLGKVRQKQAADHITLSGIPENWTLANDELYSNLEFEAQAVLKAQGGDGTTHVTTWVRETNGTRIFGTTLGHSTETIEDAIFQRLLANAVLWVTDNLQRDGSAATGLEPVATTPAINRVSKAPGIDYLTEDSRNCMTTEILQAVGPCYVRCVMHPFKWGEAADACKRDCESGVPTSEVLMQRCSAQAPASK